MDIFINLIKGMRKSPVSPKVWQEPQTETQEGVQARLENHLRKGGHITIAQIHKMGCNHGTKAISRALKKGLIEREEWFTGEKGARQKRYYGRKG